MSISLVQSRSVNGSGSLAFNSAVTGGNLIIVVVQDSGTGSATLTCSDGVNTFLSPGSHTFSTDTVQMFYVLNCTGGSLTISATSSGSVTGLSIHEFSGITTLDQTTFATGTGNTQDSGNVTTTVAIELIFGYFVAQSSSGPTSSTKGASYTLAETPNADHLTQYKTVSSTGTYSSNTTAATGKGGSTSWIEEIITFYTPAPASSSNFLSMF